MNQSVQLDSGAELNNKRTLLCFVVVPDNNDDRGDKLDVNNKQLKCGFHF